MYNFHKTCINTISTLSKNLSLNDEVNDHVYKQKNLINPLEIKDSELESTENVLKSIKTEVIELNEIYPDTDVYVDHNYCKKSISLEDPLLISCSTDTNSDSTIVFNHLEVEITEKNEKTSSDNDNASSIDERVINSATKKAKQVIKSEVSSRESLDGKNAIDFEEESIPKFEIVKVDPVYQENFDKSVEDVYQEDFGDSIDGNMCVDEYNNEINRENVVENHFVKEIEVRSTNVYEVQNVTDDLNSMSVAGNFYVNYSL